MNENKLLDLACVRFVKKTQGDGQSDWAGPAKEVPPVSLPMTQT